VACRHFSLYKRADTLPEIVAEEERQHPLDALHQAMIEHIDPSLASISRSIAKKRKEKTAR
jgi:hypothetical protein